MKTYGKAPSIGSDQEFAADAAAFIVELAHKAMAGRKEFRIALSGGNTPDPFMLRSQGLREISHGKRSLITFGDERCVPPDHQQSNYRMANETLFAPAIPEKSILRMRGELDPQLAAQEYQDQLIRCDATRRTNLSARFDSCSA